MTTPSIEMTKEYTDTLFSFQKFLISRAKFSHFVIFSAFFVESLRVNGTSMSIISDAFFCLSMNTIASVYRFISNDRLVPIYIIIIIIMHLLLLISTTMLDHGLNFLEGVGDVEESLSLPFRIPWLPDQEKPLPSVPQFCQ